MLMATTAVDSTPFLGSAPRIVTYFGGGLVVGGVATLLRRSVQVRQGNGERLQPKKTYGG